MLLDQQVTMEWAFGAPLLLKQRLGVEQLDAAAIAAMDPPRSRRCSATSPRCTAIPASMAKRTHDLCRYIVEHYDGRTEDDLGDVDHRRGAARRVQALPGFGKDKSRIFVGLLGKRLGVRPPGWELVAADWPSIADVDTFERVAEIREKKRAAKAAKKAAAPKQRRRRPRRRRRSRRRRALARREHARFDRQRLADGHAVRAVGGQHVGLRLVRRT